MTTPPHIPKLHDSRFPMGSGCSYTGPDDDEHCGVEPLVHVLVDDPDGADEMRSMPACEAHAGVAIGIADRAPFGWTAHPYQAACSTPNSTIHKGRCDRPETA